MTGCLVFAAGRDVPPKPTYEWGTEAIRCFHSSASLMREVRAEARSEGGSPDIARRVWRLGKVRGRAKPLGGSLAGLVYSEEFLVSDLGAPGPNVRTALNGFGRAFECLVKIDGHNCPSGTRSTAPFRGARDIRNRHGQCRGLRRWP